MIEYTPSNVTIDRSSAFIVDGDIPLGPAGSHQVILLDGSSNSVKATLPNAPLATTRTYTIKCIDATFQCTIGLKAPDTVDDSDVDIVLGLYEAKTVRSDGLNWWVI